jgi:predicted DNA-binding transcriptional regulator AlpA
MSDDTTTRASLADPPAVAAYLGIPLATLSQWRYRGQGPTSLRVGRHIRYRWSDVERWLAEQASTHNGTSAAVDRRSWKAGHDAHA